MILLVWLAGGLIAGLAVRVLVHRGHMSENTATILAVIAIVVAAALVITANGIPFLRTR